MTKTFLQTTSLREATPKVYMFRAEWLKGEIIQSVLCLPDGSEKVIAKVLVTDADRFAAWPDGIGELYQRRGRELESATHARLLAMHYTHDL